MTPKAVCTLICSLAVCSLFWQQRQAICQTPAKQSQAEKLQDLAVDPRLKAIVTTDFKKPKVKELLDCLKMATGLEFSVNDMVEAKQESFGSLSFRNTPAWIVMTELAKSDAVKGSWQKTVDGYKLVGTLDAKAQEARVETIKKLPNFAAKPFVEPRESSMRIWIFAAILTSVAIGAAVILVVRQRRKRHVAKPTELLKQKPL